MFPQCWENNRLLSACFFEKVNTEYIVREGKIELWIGMSCVSLYIHSWSTPSTSRIVLIRTCYFIAAQVYPLLLVLLLSSSSVQLILLISLFHVDIIQKFQYSISSLLHKCLTTLFFTFDCSIKMVKFWHFLVSFNKIYKFLIIWINLTLLLINLKNFNKFIKIKLNVIPTISKSKLLHSAEESAIFVWPHLRKSCLRPKEW